MVEKQQSIDIKAIIIILIAGMVAGSGWFLVKLQVHTVTPEMSAFYRFMLAGPIAIFYGQFVNKDKFKRDLKTHLELGVIGFFLYSIFYWFSYRTVEYIPSGIVSVIMSMMILTNALFSSVFLKEKITKSILISSVFCILSFMILFMNDILDGDKVNDAVLGFLFGFLALIAYSSGSVFVKKFHFKGMSAATISGYSMIYGGILSLCLAGLAGDIVYFESSWPYILSLLYLGLFLSPIVMISYVYISKNYSTSHAAIIWIIMPITGLLVSSLMNEFVWDLQILLGVIIGIVGICISLKK
ncbi:MAG: EamA family transporter [Alphaproteobacteria bacterium]|nr:EamA family transporter [Alphaproteobacteria bacterium]MBP9877759.1 EamA family transporter [Alphaproteobacteria bacterium]